MAVILLLSFMPNHTASGMIAHEHCSSGQTFSIDGQVNRKTKNAAVYKQAETHPIPKAT